MDDRSFTVRIPRRSVRISLIVGVTALIVAPLTAIATHTFDDVPNSHTFHGDIAWLEASGVTEGCNPPDNDEFCPDDEVTRGQMAAFMRRFAEYLSAEDGTPAQADNADQANVAINALNSESFDGRSIGCGPGETEFAGECWETEARAVVNTVFHGATACGDDGGRLPRALELRRFGQISSIDAPSDELTADVYFDGAFRVFHVDGHGLYDHATNGDGSYRCVFPLVETVPTPASASSQGSVSENGE